jgi:hypothetical protein
MGLSLFRLRNWNARFIASSIGAVLVARALNIFPFSAIANIGRTHKISLRMQVVIWFGGLRGAIAFSLAQNMPQKVRRASFRSTPCHDSKPQLQTSQRPPSGRRAAVSTVAKQQRCKTHTLVLAARALPRRRGPSPFRA